MERFSKIKEEVKKTETDNILYEDDYTKLINYEGWSVLEEVDNVICIPFLIEYNQFIIRQEYIPSYKLDEGKEYHITVLSGGIEDGENPAQALKRELEEEAGIVIRDNFEFDIQAPIFKFKGSSSKYHMCILPLTENDYHEVIAKGDGSKEEDLSKSVKVSLRHLNSIISSDTITELMLSKLKGYLNI